MSLGRAALGYPARMAEPVSETSPESESSEDTKRKFREALERKAAKAAGAAARTEGVGKQSKSHGPIGGGRREFRRKSG
jgi:hypothetical protein